MPLNFTPPLRGVEEVERFVRRPIRWGSFSVACPPTNSPAGFALASLTPPQGGSEIQYAPLMDFFNNPLGGQLPRKGARHLIWARYSVGALRYLMRRDSADNAPVVARDGDHGRARRRVAAVREMAVAAPLAGMLDSHEYGPARPGSTPGPSPRTAWAPP